MTIKNFVADKTVTTYLQEVRELKEEIKCLQEREKHLKEKIADIIADSDAICNEEGTLLATYKTIEKTVFDLPTFKKVNPEIYEEFCKHTEIRTFLLKD